MKSLELGHGQLGRMRPAQRRQQIHRIPDAVPGEQTPNERRGGHEDPAGDAAQQAGAGRMALGVAQVDHRRDDAEDELRDDEPGPFDPGPDRGVDGAQADKADRRPEQRHQQSAPSQRFGDVRQRGQQHSVHQAHDERHRGVNDNSRDQQNGIEAIELFGAQLSDAGHDHAGQQIERQPDAVSAGEPIGHGRQGHDEPAHQPAFDPGGKRMDFNRQPQAIAGQATAHPFDRGRRDGDRLRAQGGRDQRLVIMAAAGEQLGDPEAQASRQQQASDAGQRVAGGDARGEQRNAHGQHQGRGGRARHFDPLGRGVIVRLRIHILPVPAT